MLFNVTKTKRLVCLCVIGIAMVASRPAVAQRGWISGTVIDSSGTPLQYVNVIVVDSWFGDMTDKDTGEFRIEVPPGRHVLKALSMEYQSAIRDVAVRPGEDVSVKFELRRKGPEPLDGRVVTQAHDGADSYETLEPFWKVSSGFGPEVFDSIPLGGASYHYRGQTLKVNVLECMEPALKCSARALMPGEVYTRELPFAFRASDFEKWTGEVNLICLYFYGEPGAAWVDTRFISLADPSFKVPVRPIGMPYRQQR